MADDAQIAAIHNLFARYCFAIDGSNGPAFADCFTPDGRFVVTGREPVQGREDLMEFIAATSDNRPRHSYANLWVTEIDERTARAQAYFLLIDRETGENTAYGHYDDTLECGEDGWRWSERRVIFDWISDTFAARGRAAVADS